MLNNTDKFVVYLDPNTLEYMYLNYSEKRNYPVMNKLYSLLQEGFVNNIVVTPLSMDHLRLYIDEKKINTVFLNMIGGLGQVQFLQRFTVRMLQLIRVINFFFEQRYKKLLWKDAFSSDPNERYIQGFNKYHSITARNVIMAYEREKKHSQIINFIEKFKEGKPAESIAADYFRFMWEQFPDLIEQYMPVDGSYDTNMKTFLEYDAIIDIPEFHIISGILYPLFKTASRFFD